MSTNRKKTVTYDVTKLDAIAGGKVSEMNAGQKLAFAQAWAKLLNEKLPPGWRAMVKYGSHGYNVIVRKV